MIRHLAIAALAALGLTTANAQQQLPGWYPEGPAWIDGTLYWAEMQADTVFRMTPDGPKPHMEGQNCGPTAVASYGDGMLVLCHLGARLIHLDADGAKLATFRASTDGVALRNPNDASADGQGGVWFTDPGRFSANADAEGRLYHLTADGVLSLHADELAYGNGVHVDVAGQRLLLSEHLARKVWSYPLVADGLGSRELVMDLDSFDLPKPRLAEAGPDGLEIGPDGTLWVAEYGAKRLLGWQPGRGLVAALEVDAPFLTNIAFGGDGQAVLTGSYSNHEPRNRGGIWLFDASVLSEAAAQ